MLYQPCVYTFIYTICVLVITWPLYVYFLSFWYSHRHHFVIRNRWPIISLIIVALTFMIQLFTIIEATFCFKALSHLCIGISNAISGLVYYRSYLLYAQTMKTRQYLSDIVSSKRMIIQNENQRCYQLCGKVILCVITTASIAISICRSLQLPCYSVVTYSAFTATTLIGIICVINILCKKVSDSIGITKECIVQISFNFLFIFASNFVESVVPPVVSPVLSIKLWLGLLTAAFFGFFTLFVAYNLIQNANGTTPYRGKTPGINPTALGVHSSSEHQSTGLSVESATPHSPSLYIPPIHKSLSKWLNKPLVTFLGDNLKRHMLFAEYLSECFALENILFLERAIILHHIIQKYKKLDGKWDDTESAEECIFDTLCYRLKFNFLTQIYNDMEEMIKNSSKENDGMIYKRGIIEVAISIFRQFCRRGSVAEINVGYEIRNNVVGLFEIDDEEGILKQFKSYDDLLMIFHYSIEECWSLCESIYGFQFKTYLKDKLFEDNNSDNIPKNAEHGQPELSISFVEIE